MKQLIKDSIWSALLFFGILMAIGYLNDSYVGMKRMLSDPVNWVVLAVVIAASIAIKVRRQRKNESENG
ncbi:hypothetical protein ACG2F4_17030 [Halalkalibaculum sp. DA3122]|uniref:hypothetical protein n=1 Tax=unclassified Halalkalibaculum TaxID=2964617 RepID=UPI00375424D0